MCWLCRYQGEPLGKQLADFVIKNIGYMDMQCISQQVSDFLILQQPDAVAAAVGDVFAHISSHMLHPRVRMAVILRQMLEFAALLQANMVVRDGALCTVDKGNAELYLKVITQITTLYKIDPQTMLFADDAHGVSEPSNATV